MNRSTKKYCLIGLVIALMISILSYDSITYQSGAIQDDSEGYNTNLPSKPSVSPRASALDTSTEFIGETVLIHSSNGSSYHIRSNYTYVNATCINHTLTFTVDNNNDTFEIYSPMHWNYSSIIPTETLTINDTDYIYNFTGSNGNTVYTISFYSGNTLGLDYDRENIYLTLNDTSSNYLTDIGFETGSYSSDWEEDAGNQWDSITMNQTILYENNYSVRLIDTDANSDYLTLKANLKEQDYYITFNYYIASAFDVLRIEYYDTELTHEDFPDNATYRWTKFASLIHITDDLTDESYQFRISSVGSQGVLFIDNFMIGESNIQFLNTDVLGNYNISSSALSVDTYQNYGLNGSTVNYTMYERASTVEVNSTSLITNIYGYTSYIYYNDTLAELEYHLTATLTEITVPEEEDWSDYVLYTKFDEGTGNYAYDESDAGNVGDLMNTPTWTSDTPDESDYSLDFELSNSEYVRFGDEPEFSFGNGLTDFPFSVSCWVKLETIGIVQTVVGKFTSTGTLEWVFRVDSSNYVKFLCYDSSASAYIGRTASTTLLTTNTWYHIAMTYNANETSEGIKLYVDGDLEAAANTENGAYVSMEDTSSILTIGIRGSLANPTDGLIDDVRLDDEEWNTTEIAEVYNYTFPEAEMIFSVAINTYFTPKITNQHLFYYETDNEWDFTETDDGAIYSGCSDTQFNGSNSITSNGAQADMNMYWTGLSIDSSVYTHVSIRCYANVADIQVRLVDSGTYISDFQTINTSYSILEYVLSDDSDWTGIETTLNLLMDEEDGDGTLEDSDIVYFDYIRLYHEDTPVLKEASLEWWLDSQNDSYTYYYTLYDTSSTCIGLEHIEKNRNGRFDLTYIAYLDSNFPNTVLLPSETFIDTIYVKPYDAGDLDTLLSIVIEGLMVLIFFGTAILVSLFATYKIIGELLR